VNICRKSDGTNESLDVKYLSSGEIASVLDLSLVKPYHSKFLRKPKAESVVKKKTEEKQETEKSSEKLETTEKQEKSSEKQEKIEEKQETEKSSEKLETTEKQEKSSKKQEKIEEKQETEASQDSVEKQETKANQDPVEKQDNEGLTRQALKFVVERRQARRNLSPRSSRRRVRRNTRPVATPKVDLELESKPEAELESKPEAELENKPEAELENKPEAELENKPEAELENKPEAELESKPEEGTLDAESTPTRPSRPHKLASTPECMKDYEADRHAAISVPVSMPDFMKNYEAERDAAISIPVSLPDFMKNYEAERDAAISVPADPTAGSTLDNFQATSLPEINFQATALLPETREVVVGEYQTKGINSDNFLELVSESKDLLNGIHTQNEEPLSSTPQRSMETKVDTSWTESPCPISTPKRLLYPDECRDTTPPPTRRVDGRVIYDSESQGVEIRARVASRLVSTPPRSENEGSFETSSVVSTPRKNNRSLQDATLETLEDTDRSGEMEDASLETTLSATSAPTEEDSTEENEETKILAKESVGSSTVSYLHTLLVGDDSYSLGTASIEEMDQSNSYDSKILSATTAPSEENAAKESEESKIASNEKTGNTTSYLHSLLVGDSYSLGTASIEEMDQSNSYDYNTDQSATDDDTDERSTCSEVLPRSKKMEPDSRFDFCASSDTIAADFRLVAKILARSGALFTSTGRCPPERRTPERRFPKRRAHRADTMSYADSHGDTKTSSSAATEELIDISVNRVSDRPKSNGSNDTGKNRHIRFAC
jgi:hypothetical protein